MPIETVKGFRDIEDASKRNQVKNIIENLFKLYGFIPVETPIIEYEDFVVGDNVKDEAVSERFKLQDRGKRKLALRYEFTFQLKRLAKNKKLPYKIYQVGSVFRDEPVSSNRWRQFTQCDADIIGADLNSVGEILKLSSEILGKLNINFNLNINSRKLLNEILDKNGIKESYREDVIRELDKLDKISEKEVRENLKKYGAEKILSIFKKQEDYFEMYESYNDIKDLKELCKLYEVKVNFQPFLARGLSYYNWIVFEIKSDIKETITAGGSYLVNGIQATGISFGLDRLELLAKIDNNLKRVLVVSLGQDKKAIGLTRKVREMGISCEIFYGKPGKALSYADSKEIDFVIFVGDDEVKKGKFKVKNMKTGDERMVGEGVLGKVLG